MTSYSQSYVDVIFIIIIERINVKKLRSRNEKVKMVIYGDSIVH